MESPGVSYADTVRQTVRQMLTELGCEVASELQEAILIRKGQYCGRRFQAEGGMAVWFIEEKQIKYYGADGALLSVTAAPGADSVRLPVVPRRRAA